MLTSFISITNLQRKMRSVFDSKDPMRIVLSKNAVTGIVFSKEAAEVLLSSGLLDQLREELWEMRDRETRDVVSKHRAGKAKVVPFDQYARKYGV